jgi:tetratricopeptide (TPR) repeat protein
MLAPNRAEFHCLMGDAYVKLGQLQNAIPCYEAAKGCALPVPQGIADAIFFQQDTYSHYPRNQLARIYFHLGRLEDGLREAEACEKLHASIEAHQIRKEIEVQISQATAYKKAKPCGDIVISCPPHAPYTWDADIAKETWELENQPEHELEELKAIFKAKGLSDGLASEVAIELTQKDALKVHLEEELGITPHNRARPFQAASSSALAFAVGASLPLLAVVIASEALRIWATLALVLVALVGLGYFGARFGGARAKRPIARVVVGGFIAIAFTMAIGWLFGTAIA